MKRLLALLLVLLAAGPAFGQTVVQTDNVRAELLADVAAVKPGEPFWVGLRQTIRPKWHTYWKNPGESGLPTEIKWTLPEGVKADPIVWPTPHLYDIGGVINYGFQNEAMLLVRITPPADLGGASLKLAAEANWLVCEDVCIPEDGKFELSLPIAAAATPAAPATRAIFDKARQSVPTESPWPARYGVAKSGDPTLIVEAKGLKPEMIRDVYFFPAEWGPIASMARQTATVGADGIRIPLKRGDAKAALPEQLAGTLVLTEKTADGEIRQAFDVSAKLDPAFVPSSSLAAADGLFALLGGLILNLMPCVFPVLAMKAASFVRLAGHERSAMRRDGLAYTAGVLVSFAAMAAVVVAIRASVGEVSWGFQFQSPIFSLLIAYLFFVVGLNLSGVFEIGGRFAGVGQGLAARGGTTGAFFTGVLAVIVATPCTVPFMAAALGFALSQPAPQTVAVLLALGLGLALPYLVLTAAGSVDGAAAPVPRLPDVCLCRVDDLGADPAGRRRRCDLRLGRHDPDRLRHLAVADRTRRLARHVAAPRTGGGGRPAGVRRGAQARGQSGHGRIGGRRPGGRRELRRMGALFARTSQPGRRRRQASVRRFHRRLVHYLPGERAGGAGDSGRPPRL